MLGPSAKHGGEGAPLVPRRVLVNESFFFTYHLTGSNLVDMHSYFDAYCDEKQSGFLREVLKMSARPGLEYLPESYKELVQPLDNRPLLPALPLQEEENGEEGEVVALEYDLTEEEFV